MVYKFWISIETFLRLCDKIFSDFLYDSFFWDSVLLGNPNDNQDNVVQFYARNYGQVDGFQFLAVEWLIEWNGGGFLKIYARKRNGSSVNFSIHPSHQVTEKILCFKFKHSGWFIFCDICSFTVCGKISHNKRKSNKESN